MKQFDIKHKDSSGITVTEYRAFVVNLDELLKLDHCRYFAIWRKEESLNLVYFLFDLIWDNLTSNTKIRPGLWWRLQSFCHRWTTLWLGQQKKWDLVDSDFISDIILHLWLFKDICFEIEARLWLWRKFDVNNYLCVAIWFITGINW